MKLKKVQIVVEPFAKVKKRWKKALQGKLKSKGRLEVISVGNWDILGKVLSTPRLRILAAIPALKSHSIAQLAKALEKDFKNVYSDVKFLAGLGLIELKEEGNRKTLIPIARFRGIEFPLAA